MPEAFDESLRASLRMAYRHFHDKDTTEAERDHILKTMAKHLPSSEAEAASRALYHREEERRQQLTLALLLGIDPTRPN